MKEKKKLAMELKPRFKGVRGPLRKKNVSFANKAWGKKPSTR